MLPEQHLLRWYEYTIDFALKQIENTCVKITFTQVFVSFHLQAELSASLRLSFQCVRHNYGLY